MSQTTRARRIKVRQRLLLVAAQRVYWFTVEFGVVREAGDVKAYGTGLLSSAGELGAMRHAALRPLDLEAASRREYDPTRYQPVLFCTDSFEELYERLREFLVGWRRRASAPKGIKHSGR